MNENELDKITFIAIVNGHTLSKESGKLLLTEVDPTNPAHKYCMSCMATVFQITSAKPEIGLKKSNLFNWWKLKRKYKFLSNFKLSKKEGKKMQDFIYDIEDANNLPGAFKKAWEEYYGN